MLIRNQEKNELIDANCNFHMWVDKYDIGHDKNKNVVRINGYILGIYSTMEKAKQVLTDIELELLAESKIFIMPQDDEVEVRK